MHDQCSEWLCATIHQRISVSHREISQRIIILLTELIICYFYLVSAILEGRFLLPFVSQLRSWWRWSERAKYDSVLDYISLCLLFWSWWVVLRMATQSSIHVLSEFCTGPAAWHNSWCKTSKYSQCVMRIFRSIVNVLFVVSELLHWTSSGLCALQYITHTAEWRNERKGKEG